MSGNDDKITVHLVSDRMKPVNGRLVVRAYKFDGTPVSSFELKIILPGERVKTVSLPTAKVYAGADTCNMFVHSIFSDGETDYENIFLPSSHKDIRLPEPKVTLNVRNDGDDLYVDVKSDTFVRAFKIYFNNDTDYFLADNYFDLIPGIQYSVKLKTDMSIDEAEESIGWTSLYNATN